MSVQRRIRTGLIGFALVVILGRPILAGEIPSDVDRFSVTGVQTVDRSVGVLKQKQANHWIVEVRSVGADTLVTIKPDAGATWRVYLGTDNHIERIETEKFVAGKWKRFVVPTNYVYLEARYSAVPIRELLAVLGIQREQKEVSPDWILQVEGLK